MAKDTGKKLADMMYGQNPEQAAFGVFPQMKPRRSRQDPEAAKNVPVDLARGFVAGTLGMPGDIESFVRLPYELITGNESPTILPTSEQIEKRLPFGSDTPASRAAAGLGTLAGGFYIGPGSGARAVTAVPKAVKKAGKDFGRAAGQSGLRMVQQTRQAPQEEALRLARERAEAAGQSPNPRTRMLQQGFEEGWYHGTTGDIKNFNPQLLGETTGAQSAKKGFFFARDPQNPPESMLKKSTDQKSIDMLRGLGIPEEEIQKLNTVSMKGHGAETASGYAQIGGSREYKEAMRKAKAAESRGDWTEYERQMQIAEDSEMSRINYAQELVAKYGDVRDEMLEAIEKSIYSKKLPQDQAEALDQKVKQLMPYGWYNSYSNPQIEGLKQALVNLVGSDNAKSALSKINKFQSVRNERALAEKTQEGGNVMPVALRYEKPMVYDFEGKPYRDQSYSDLVDQALASGHDALILKNTYDPGGGPSKLIDVGVVFEPDQIRSRNAAFDPLRKTAAAAAAAGLAAPDLLAKEVPQEETVVNPPSEYAKGGIVKGALQAIQKAAGDAGMKKPVVAEKELTTLQDTYTTLGDRIRMEAELAKKQMEGFDYKYDAGQRVFTKDSAGKNKPPYEILRRTRVGNQIVYDTNAGGMKPVIDPSTGKAMRTPYEPGYRVRSQRGDEWSEFDVPQSAIVGDVEMAKGGSVMPAAKIGGEEFVRAAEKYGLRTDNATLNQIVSLVNQGMSVDQAAMKIAGAGRVQISDNPDVMQLELAKGGAVAALKRLVRAPAKTKQEIEAVAERMAPQVTGEYVRAKPGSAVTVAGKTKKQFEREKSLPVDIRPTAEERIPQPVDIEKLKGEVMIGIPGDPTVTGKTLYSVGETKLGSPAPQHGGPLYGLYHDNDHFWASGLGAARRVQNLAREAAEQYDAPVVGKYIMMGPDSINYAQHFADANLQAIDLSKMSKKQIEQFNKLIRFGNPKSGPRPSFPGIEDKESAYLHMAMDPELRKHFNALMQQNTVTEAFNLPSGNDIRFAITEPALRDLETGVTGFSMGRMRPDIPSSELKLSEHPTYSHDIPGHFLGQSKYPIPYELSFPDTLKSVRENPKQAASEFGSLKMVGPRQTIDQQLIDELRMYEERMKQLTGKKKGGAVRKAAGGEITADDLILEERKL